MVSISQCIAIIFAELQFERLVQVTVVITMATERVTMTHTNLIATT